MRFVVALKDSRTDRFVGFINTKSLKKNSIRTRIANINPEFKKLGKPFKYDLK